MSDCLNCTKAAQARRREFDAAMQKAKQEANESKKPIAVCKKGKQEKIFTYPAAEARGAGYIILDIASYLQ
jgi:hypothetical protein